MRVEEAKKKWCPYARVAVNDGQFSANRAEGPDPYEPVAFYNSTCMGPNCMAWRWKPMMADDAYKNAVIKAAAEIGDKSETKVKAARHVNENRAQYGLPTEPFDGYCGLAGVP